MIEVSNRFAFWIALGRIFSMLIVFVMPLALTRFLSQEEYGTFSQFFTLYSTLYVISSLGIHTSLFYYYPTASKKNQDIYVSNTLAMLLLMGCVVFVTLNIPFVKFALFGDDHLLHYSKYSIICISLAVPMNMISPLCTVRKDAITAALAPAFVALFRVGIIIGTIILTTNFESVFRSLVLYQCIILLFVISYSLYQCRLHIDIKLIKIQLTYALPFGLTIFLQLFSNYFDKIVSIHFLTVAEYAIYSVAFLSIPGINQIYDSLCQVNIVNMTRCYQGGEQARIVPLYKDFVTKTLSFSTPIILSVSLFSEEIMCFLYPSAYSGAAGYFRIYSLTFLVSMFGAGTILRAIDKTPLSLKAFILSSLIGLPVTYWLVRIYGIHGSIIGAVINILLPRIFQIYIEMKVMEQSLSDYLPWKQIVKILLLGCVFLLPCILCKMKFEVNIIWSMFISFFYILVCYGVYIQNNIFILNTEKIGQISLYLKKRILK